MTLRFKFSLQLLYIFIPIAVALRFMGKGNETFVFITACLAIIPLAGAMGEATEAIAEKTGAGIGGLLNASFGNAAELIIAFMALKAGLYEVVKASITGSIIGNILLVLGASLFAGGLKYPIQEFNQSGVRNQATMLTLAAIALLMPALFHSMGGEDLTHRDHNLSFYICWVLLITYFISLLFSLRTHKDLFSGAAADHDETVSVHEKEDHWSMKRAVTTLFVATAFVAWMSELLVSSVEHAAVDLGMNHIFVGVIVVAIIGNAAEHSSAIMMAMKNRMDLSVGIALGSSIQIALFVAPLLVLLSYLFGPVPMDLLFTPIEVVAVALGIYIAGQVAGDGRSHWFEGVQLLVVYVIFGLVFFFLPNT